MMIREQSPLRQITESLQSARVAIYTHGLPRSWTEEIVKSCHEMAHRFSSFEVRDIASFEEANRGWPTVPPILITDQLLLPAQAWSTQVMRQPDCPVLILSDSNDLAFIENNFALGAIDFLHFPFDHNLFQAKLARLVRLFLSQNSTEGLPSFAKSDELQIDSINKSLSHPNGIEIELTDREFKIFVALYWLRGQCLSRAELQDRVWGKTQVSSKTLDVHLYHLRRKLQKISLLVEFIRPDGYRLRSEK